MLTNEYLLKERAHLEGTQRLYEFPNKWGLSLVNSKMLHAYPFAWEAAVLNPAGNLDYSTPLTDDTEVFMSDDEANDFIEKAKSYFLGEAQPDN